MNPDTNNKSTPGQISSLDGYVKERIIVIDDERRICESLTTLLSDSGYDVKAFQNSEEASREIKKGRFDLIISDIKMPGMSGFDILRLARTVDPQALVILLTGFGSLESAIEAINKGVYDYLLKPVEYPQLELVIRRGLEKRRLGRAKSFLLTELQEKNLELQTRLDEINALYEAGQSLGSTIDLDELLDRIIYLATDVLRAKIGSIMLLDDNREYLTIASARGLNEKVIKTTRLPIGSSIAGYVADTGQPLFIANVEADARFRRENREERYGHASLLSTPLMLKKKVTGVINIAHKESGGEFGEHDLKLLNTFAAQAAVAIDNASAVRQLKRRVAELSTLQEIADAMSRAGSAESLQEIIFWGIRNLMPADISLWFRWNEKENLLTFMGSAGNTKFDIDLSIRADPEKIMSPESARNLILEKLAERDSSIPVSSFLAFPITGSSGLAYVFCLASGAEDCFSQEDEKIAGLIASQTATMYEREKAILNATQLLTMGNMISEISHDMRKPLTSIRGALQIMHSRWPELAEQSDLFKVAEEEVHRLNDLVRELVDFSNPNKYQTEKVDIAAVIDRAHHLIKPELQKKNIECRTEYEEHLPELFINKNQIIEMMLNLLMNAIDAISEDKGYINVRAIRDQVDNRKMVRIEVTDNGCGIDETEKSAIFDRYFTTKETGTGLGLSVVERIVSAHNGRIEVKSQKNNGTSFIIHLPI
jgi:K+-sensing histidine kinase KdpD